MTERQQGSDRGTEVEKERERKWGWGKRWTEREPNIWEESQSLRARERQRARFRDDGVNRDDETGSRAGNRNKGSEISRQTEPERKWDTESKRNSEKERDPEGKRWGEGIRERPSQGKRIWGRERDWPVRTEAGSQPRAAPHPPHPHADYRGSNLRT